MEKYNAKSIKIVENLEAIRKRPGMYIGDTGSNGLLQLFREILDNSIDEYLSGHAQVIEVVIHEDGSISVMDDGRGIPIDIHPKTKKPAIETIFTTLHSGSKFGGKSTGYKFSGGLHGVGSSVVNALSSSLNATVWKKKKEYVIEFHEGGKLKTSLTKKNSSHKSGTKIRFKPDYKIFSNNIFIKDEIKSILKTSSFLNTNLRIIYLDEVNNKKEEYYTKNGMSDYLDTLGNGRKTVVQPIFINSKTDNFIFNVAFKYNDTSSFSINSFANNIRTIDGGSHESSFFDSLTTLLNEYSKSKFKLIDIKSGINIIISIYLTEDDLQFRGQTKSKLTSLGAERYVKKITALKLKEEFIKDRTIIDAISNKVLESQNERKRRQNEKDIKKNLRQTTVKSFAGKLVPSQQKNPKNNELFLVEGDSAGGSAKLGRNRKTQAILPLKGKILNSEKANIKSVLENEEIAMLINAIGCGIRGDLNLRKLNYHKIIIMTDADTDGAHIQTLILTFLFRFMKPIIENGYVYIALPPLFKITNKYNKKIDYLWSDKELEEFKEQNSKGIEIQRYKGLGEMNYEQLWDTTMNPDTRTLIKVKISDEKKINLTVKTLMGQDPKSRREWIEKNIVFD